MDGAVLQTQLNQSQQLYNTQRPHRAINGLTPAQAYTGTPKATPRGTQIGDHYRLRLDHVDTGGKVSLRHAGRMHHLGIGAKHARQPVILLIDPDTVTVTHRTTAEVLSEHHIDPTRTYWRNHQKEPGRWPSSQQ